MFNVVDSVGNVVGIVLYFWFTMGTAYIRYNDGTEGTNADKRFQDNCYKIIDA